MAGLEFLLCFLLDQSPSLAGNSIFGMFFRNLAFGLFSMVGLCWLPCLSVWQGIWAFIAKSEREFMRNFGLSQSSFLQSQLFIEPIITSPWSYLPALLIFSSLSGNWLYLPLGLLTIPAGSFTGQALNRALFNRGILARRNSWQSWVILGTSLAAIASLILLRNHLSPIFLLPVLACQVLLIGLATVIWSLTDQPSRLSLLLHGPVLADG